MAQQTRSYFITNDPALDRLYTGHTPNLQTWTDLLDTMALQVDMTAAEALLATHVTSIATLTSQMANKVDQSVFDALETRMDTAEADIISLESAITGFATSIASLETDKADKSYVDATFAVSSANYIVGGPENIDADILALQTGKLETSVYDLFKANQHDPWIKRERIYLKLKSDDSNFIFNLMPGEQVKILGIETKAVATYKLQEVNGCTLEDVIGSTDVNDNLPNISFPITIQKDFLFEVTEFGVCSASAGNAYVTIDLQYEPLI